ncbi:ATP-binding protein [Nocardia salmonicida]|uniref:ATP-binding protein n=1 Tax=Nocardia salmonicida TaxID=53431 RepID=UPI003639CE35
MNSFATESSYATVGRSVARLIAWGYLGYGVLLASRIVTDAAFVAPWWTIVAVGAVLIAPPLVLFGTARAGDIVVVQRGAVLIGALFLAVAALWPLAWTGEALLGATWLSFVPGLAAMATGLAWKPRVTIGYLVVAVAAAQLINQQRVPGVNFAFGLEMLYGFGFSLVFVAMVLEAMRTAGELDRTRAATERQARTTATAEAGAAQQRVHDALVHDWTIATLLAAVRLPPSPALRAHADLTLSKMNAMPLAADAQPVTVAELVAVLRASVTEVAAALDIEVLSTVYDATFDSRAVYAAAQGVAEAVRNSLRHSTTTISTRIRADIGDDDFRVEVVDNGPGFDVTLVPADRFGVRGTISQLDHLDGGTVTVESRPGQGTRVSFQWHRPVENIDRPDIQQFLGIRTRAAIFVAACYLVGIGALAVMSTHGHMGWLGGAALLVFTCMAVLFIVASRDPVSRWVSLGAVLGPVGATIAIGAMPILNSPDQLWPASATAAIYALLIVRGRRAEAWFGQVAVVTVCAVWAQSQGIGLLGLLNRLADFAPLVGATAFARVARPPLLAIIELRNQALALTRQEAAVRAGIIERGKHLAAFDEIVRPVIVEIARGQVLSERSQQECALLEARLRDGLRGGVLADHALAQPIHAARRRGVEILLYDDHGIDDCTTATRDALFATVATELDAVSQGRVTIRISPPGRECLATIVTHTPVGSRRATVRRPVAVDAQN